MFSKMHSPLNRFNTLALILIAGNLLSGCMSLPKPDEEDLVEVPKLIHQYKDQVKNETFDEAIQTLLVAKNKVTSNGKFAGGEGAFFRDEAQFTALIGHIEFSRSNLNEAASKWHDSFEIQLNGLKNQYEIDQKNQRINDLLGTGLSESAAKSSAQKTGEKSYSYTVYNTKLPNPKMLTAGMPDSSVMRVPVAVEAPPFDNIVKLSNLRSSCTATMVSPWIAISAAHCMSQSGEAINPKLMTLKREGIFATSAMKVLKYFTHNGENKGWDKSRKNDWLILVTESRYDKTGNFPKVLENVPDAVAAGDEKVMLAGYSSDLSQGYYLTLHYGCTFKQDQFMDIGIYLSNCENAKGSSGAAVMRTRPPYEIVAIHTAQLIGSKDEFYSVETFGTEFVTTLKSTMDATNHIAEGLSESQKLEKLRQDNLQLAATLNVNAQPKLKPKSSKGNYARHCRTCKGARALPKGKLHKTKRPRNRKGR